MAEVERGESVRSSSDEELLAGMFRSAAVAMTTVPEVGAR
jgi:hypothetical protein